MKKALAVLGLLATVHAQGAEEGVQPDAIVISRVIALDGPAGAKGREQEAALDAYFRSVNAAGGVHGRRIVLRTTNLDLQNDNELRAIYESQRPFALFLLGGTQGAMVAMKLAQSLKIPFVAPNTGANVFHEPPSRYVFNVRARYRDEVTAAVRHFALVNQRRLALVQVNNPFGIDAAQNFREGIRSTGAQAVYEGQFSADKPDLAPHVAELVKAAPDVVVCIGSSKHVAELITRARKAGLTSSIMTLSNNSSAGFVQELGAYARGVIVSQVMPPPGVPTTRLSRELSQLPGIAKSVSASYAAMDAYASAKVLVEGLRRAGPSPTRENFVQALETLSHFDLGGLEIDYGDSRRTGSTYVDLTIIGDNGKFLR